MKKTELKAQSETPSPVSLFERLENETSPETQAHLKSALNMRCLGADLETGRNLRHLVADCKSAGHCKHLIDPKKASKTQGKRGIRGPKFDLAKDAPDCVKSNQAAMDALENLCDLGLVADIALVLLVKGLSYKQAEIIHASRESARIERSIG